MKIYISQPMRGYTPAEIDQVREDITQVAQSMYGESAEIIDNFVTDETNEVACLGRSIQSMKDADLIIFANGWEKSRGCNIEHEVAELYGFKYIEIKEAEDEVSEM